ncbi:MAG: DUF4167 domain-containing protein [Aestuariivirga sp.]
MRPGQHNNKRGRGRNNRRHGGGSGGGGGGGGGGGNPLSRVYESNGPDVKVRGTAQTIADKYLQLGRDAQSASDIVMAESYYQFAEHYLRIVSAAQAYQQQYQQQFRKPGDDEGDEGDDGADGEGEDSPAMTSDSQQPGLGDQPDIAAAQAGDMPEQPRQQQRPREFRDNRDNREGGGRERFRPRWQDKRDRNQDPPRDQDGETRSQPARNEDAPADNGQQAEESGQWEAPSFLRTPLPVTASADEAPVEPSRPARTRRAKAVEAPPAEDAPQGE